MFESTGLLFWVRVVLALLAVAFVRRMFFSGRQGAERQKVKARRRRSTKAKRCAEESESEFSDEPSAPVMNSIVDPVAQLEALPRIPLRYSMVEEDEMVKRALDFYELMNKRRTVREFSSRDVPVSVVENIIRTAGTSPSGAHTEPWTYVVVRDAETKAAVRQIVEMEEEINYDRRMGNKWVQDVSALGTDHEKAYLEDAPYLIIAFEQTSGSNADGSKKLHYYSRLSCAISCGLLLAAIHNAGLVTVTSTPMNAYGALRDLFNRPRTEKAFLLLPIGYPADGVTVPDLQRKPLDEIMILK